MSCPVRLDLARASGSHAVQDMLPALDATGESSSSENLHPSMRGTRQRDRTRRTRSMSHAFPGLSFFSGRKKQVGPGTNSSDDEDEDDNNGPARRQKSPKHHGLRTGNCRTCGSLIQWPRGLDVYRCGICAAVNDVCAQPAVDTPPLLSAADGRALIDRCLRTFLCRALEARGDITHERMFRPVEDYIISSFTSFACLNSSFARYRTPQALGAKRPEPPRRRPPDPPGRRGSQPVDGVAPMAKLDAKVLLAGDFAENGCWWAGQEKLVGRSDSHRSEDGPSLATSRSPGIDWAELTEWYGLMTEAARSWKGLYDGLVAERETALPEAELLHVERQLLAAQEHVQRTLLKATETILKRPGRPLSDPADLRFLLIIAANPLLHAAFRPFAGVLDHPAGSRPSGPASGRHSVIIKRVLGLLAHAPAECHTALMAWFARYPEARLVQLKDLASAFLSYRLLRQRDKNTPVPIDVTEGLIPSTTAGSTPASLHAALGRPGKEVKEKTKKTVYEDDWQIKAAAQVLSLMFTANGPGRRRRQVLATSDFYLTLLDDSDLMADFEAWERRRPNKFSFCHYPFLLSIGAKIRILEHDAKRQMQTKARDAFFSSIMTRRQVEQFLTLHIRRDCLVEDSLRAVREVIGSGGEDVKKALRIVFAGEEGVDAGGLRKEWFLLLVREVFNPEHAMFDYDEDSRYCYFNPHSLEPTEQYFLVGVVFGLAIYNSTILDAALPPYLFRKLLAAAPTTTPRAAATTTTTTPPTLADLAEYRPALAAGLRQLLEFDGDVEATYCRDFVVETSRFGAVDRVALCAGGESRPVTRQNRREYVDLYVRHVLDAAVARQFEPFKRGFFTVCGGNALSLFGPDEIELLVRGSDEPLHVEALKVAAEYENWSRRGSGGGGGHDDGDDDDRAVAEQEPTIQWFWSSLQRASPRDQRRLLLFVTGSDRIPAAGAASLRIRIVCLGDECHRFPSARTCFNVLALYRYTSRERLETALWTAVFESEGFGLK